MEMGVKIEPVPKCLDGREIPGQTPEGQAAKITQEAPLVLETLFQKFDVPFPAA
jgi:hypothetical protein